jgi:hypothetical protein
MIDSGQDAHATAMVRNRSSIALAAGSLLCLMVIALWASSFFFVTTIYFRPSTTRSIGVYFEQGTVNLASQTNSPSMPFPSIGLRLRTRLLSFNSRNSFQRSLFDFRWFSQTIPLPPQRKAVIRLFTLTFPMWILLPIVAAVPAWIFFSVERRSRWTFRTNVTQPNSRLRVRIFRFALFSIVGMILGATVATIDIQTNLSEDQGAWLLMLLALLPVVSLMAVFTRRRIPWNRAILWMALELAGCVCFFESTVDFVWRENRINHFEGIEILESILYVGFACFIIGATLLLFLQVKPEPVKPGPYCPECGYCLLGSTRNICTECGRPFTLEELGVADLNV